MLSIVFSNQATPTLNEFFHISAKDMVQDMFSAIFSAIFHAIKVKLAYKLILFKSEVTNTPNPDFLLITLQVKNIQFQ